MSVNEDFFDAMIRHQIGLLRVTGSVRARIFAILDATEKDIADQIARRLPTSGTVTTARLNTLLKSIQAIRNEAWVRAAAAWREELLAIGKAEPAFIAQALRTVSPVQLDLLLPAADLLRSVVLTRPFEGKVLRDWAKKIATDDIDRINRAIQIGVAQGQPPAQIARNVVGTVRQKGRNGVTEITRRQAAAITRTAVISITNQAKREFYKANADLFTEELYVATLDNRTTPICQSLDGKKYPVGQGPIPPLHFNCRSLRVALISGDALGSRPARAYTNQELIREYNRANGTKATSRADLPRGHKGSFDEYRARRIRELTGTVDAKVSYQDWLTRQSAQFQDDILGPTRGKLFRAGGLTLDKFVDRAGDQLTLAELARKNAAAFRAAGLDPDKFI